MPPFLNNPFQQVPLLIPGTPAYLLGSYNFSQAQGRILITHMASTTTVVNLIGNLVEGPPPIVGATISIQQTQTGSGALNCNRAVITAVTFNSTTGAVSITATFANAGFAGGSDTGTAIVDNPEIPEALANGASTAYAVAHQQAQQYGNRTFAVEAHFPSLPTAAVVSFQAAIHNVDSEFATIAPVTTVVGGAVTAQGNLIEVTSTELNYFRVLVSGVSGGTSPSVVCKVLA